MIKTQSEFEALNNAVSSLSMSITLHTYTPQDKRKNVLFYLSHQGASISPKLDYDQMNHFILGMSRAKQII